MKPCPFCGSAPAFGYRGKNAGATVVECSNRDCPVSPHTDPLSHSAALAAWDARSAESELARALAPFAAIRAEDGDDFSGWDDAVILRCEVSVAEIREARRVLQAPETGEG